MRENRTYGSYGEGLETDRESHSAPRQPLTRQEYFKALKTGCVFEKLQIESYDAITNALGVFLPIAWRMLLLRNLARSVPDAPSETVVSPAELEVLQALGSEKLPASPSVQQVLLAVAIMGGYRKHRVQPGWLVLARGFQKLTLLVQGWNAARQAQPPLHALVRDL